METNSIFSIIRQEINNFTYNFIEVVPGFTFNQHQTIKKIHLYTNSRFEDNTPYHNREKIFFNIVNYRRDTVMKALDIDTKDIKLIPLNPDSTMKTFLMEKEFAYWMKKNKLAELINRTEEDFATFGSVVIKTSGTKPENVDLRRFFLDPTVDMLKDSRFVTQEHYMTQTELNDMRGKWDDKEIDKVIERFGSVYAPQSYENNGMTNIEGVTPYYKVYERYGDVPRHMLEDDIEEGKEDELVRAMFVVAEPSATYVKQDSKMKTDKGVILLKQKWDMDYPFEDCHFSKTRGRWLGVGPVELLFPAQERFNEMANQKRIAMELSSIHLFQTTDRNSPTNLSTYLNSGDVLVVNSEITPIANEERNLSAFTNEEELYNTMADRLTFAYDAARGEALPSSTPATNAAIQNNNLNSYFNFKREIFGLFLQRIFNDKILPQLIKDLSVEHMLRFIGEPEEVARIDELVSPYFVKQQVIKEVVEGNVVDNVRLQQIEQEVSGQLKKRGAERFINVVKNHYKDAEFEFDFIVTNEQQDTQVMSQNMFNIMQQLAQNPNLIDDPVLRTVFYKYLEEIGIQPMEIEMAVHQREQLKQQMQQQALSAQQQIPGAQQPQAQQKQSPQQQPQGISPLAQVMGNQQQ
jgi:hypothetical protein